MMHDAPTSSMREGRGAGCDASRRAWWTLRAIYRGVAVDHSPPSSSAITRAIIASKLDNQLQIHRHAHLMVV
jgi:hypothetical protein